MTDTTQEKAIATQQGSEISEADRQRYKQAVATISLFHPMWGHRKVKDALEANKITIGYNLTNELLQEIKRERLDRFNEEAKEQAHAQFEDMMYWVIERCREVMAEEIKVRDSNGTVKQQYYAQQNRIAALKLAMEAMEKLMNFKMDLGIFERQLGHVSSDERVLDLAELWREYNKNPEKYDRELETIAEGKSQ